MQVSGIQMVQIFLGRRGRRDQQIYHFGPKYHNARKRWRAEKELRNRFCTYENFEISLHRNSYRLHRKSCPVSVYKSIEAWRQNGEGSLCLNDRGAEGFQSYGSCLEKLCLGAQLVQSKFGQLFGIRRWSYNRVQVSIYRQSSVKIPPMKNTSSK